MGTNTDLFRTEFVRTIEERSSWNNPIVNDIYNVLHFIVKLHNTFTCKKVTALSKFTFCVGFITSGLNYSC